MKRFFAALLFLGFIACNNDNNNGSTSIQDNDNPPPPVIDYQVIKVYPHDTSNYTQGLEWYNNMMYEGTGREGFSKLMKEDLQTGKAAQQIKINNGDFGEGVTVFNNKIYQLTWQSNKVYVYDLNSFKKLQEFDWPYEGWGITNDGKNLIVSTGSSNLYYVNPYDFKVEKTVGVTDNYGPVSNLNELEFVKGSVYANIYETDYIIKINAETGKVEGKLDLSNIRQKNGITKDDHQDFLNGIAYDSSKNSFYITGKLWPALFEIKLNQ